MVFVVKPVPKAATHAATRLPIIDQVVDMVRRASSSQLSWTRLAQPCWGWLPLFSHATVTPQLVLGSPCLPHNHPCPTPMFCSRCPTL